MARKMSKREAWAAVALGVVNIDGLGSCNIEKGSLIYRGMVRVVELEAEASKATNVEAARAQVKVKQSE